MYIRFRSGVEMRLTLLITNPGEFVCILGLSSNLHELERLSSHETVRPRLLDATLNLSMKHGEAISE
jgi:hypothetical protein